MNEKKENFAQPLSLKERVHFLDIVRGFAMLGIIIVNYFLIVDSVKGFDMNSSDLVHNLVSTFAEGKFITLFSFLFGVGFMIFMDRAVERVEHPRMLFARRLLILFCIGLLHITFIWVGDILTFYAVAGFLLLAFYARTPKTILRWIIALILIQFLTPVFMMVYNAMNTASSNMPTYFDFTLNSHTSLTYWDSLIARWADMGVMAASSFSTVYSMFLMFLIGMYFVKMDFFTNMEAKQSIWKRIWFISLAAFILTQFSSMVNTLISAENTFWMELFMILGQQGNLTGSMFYMSSLAMLFLYVPALRKALMVFTKVGRMSLTCYLLHSIMGTVILLPYAFGLASSIKPIGTLMLSIAVYVVLVIFASLWLKRFKIGPMESIWRKLTYGKINRASKTTPANLAQPLNSNLRQ
ncbi:DUF418 domain-containing protein [Paenibacillus cucumis (ex Kampfer et al. 2016)]|uniref:DUF418 domain-containing protein n=1 Tax=Paenibacillus cucumis (ex Kampfer et al. 2016) TaxID=1776858 RepID=A0ABS7KL82_9BACL|nr:DUF418 domain-containing protein [Paenibacillus cucumis (ex Kampfer et al. 2016)]MBY0204898.1 DUF418 domain-containing protein [Paenibacillus cucumis (ex Kampfer et al. 2016)]